MVFAKNENVVDQTGNNASQYSNTTGNQFPIDNTGKPVGLYFDWKQFAKDNWLPLSIGAVLLGGLTYMFVIKK